MAADKFRYIAAGSLDDPGALPPKGELFCKARVNWMPEIPGMLKAKVRLSYMILTWVGIFHKQEIKE